MQLWDEGDGLEATLSRHRACWHQTCRSRLLHTTSLSRKRRHEDVAANDELLDHTDVNISDKPTVITSRSTRTSSGITDEIDNLLCFFCNERGKDLRQVMTWPVDEQVRKCAAITHDNMLLSKLARGDMIAQEAKYHPVCLLALYRTAAQKQPEQFDVNVGTSDQPSEMDVNSLALAELIAYMEDVRSTEFAPSVFKLSELTKLYSSQLQKHHIGSNSKVNSSRLKDRLMENYPGLTSVNHGRDVLLTYSEHIGEALQLMRDTSDAKAIHMMHTVKATHNEIFSHKFEFDGSFSAINNVPQWRHSLLTRVDKVQGPPRYKGPPTSQVLSTGITLRRPYTSFRTLPLPLHASSLGRLALN